MFLVLLKIKEKIYFESLNTHDEMVEFIESIEKKFGGIEYKKSVIISGDDNIINELMEAIEEKYYLYIVGRKLDEKVYKDLIELVSDFSKDIQITFGIEFCEDEIFEEIPVVVNNSISTDSLMDSSVLKSVIESNDIIDFENQKYEIYFLYYPDKIFITMNEPLDNKYDSSKSFKQTFNNFDECLAVFDGFRQDFMEIIENDDESSLIIKEYLEILQTFIENKILMMNWKDVQNIKYLNGRFRENKIDTHSSEIYTDTDYMTAREVMKLLRISDQTLSNWRKNNLIDYKKISNRKYLYSMDNVQDIFENGVDTSGINNSNLELSPGPINQIKQIDYNAEITKILKPLAFKIPAYKYKVQNFFLNFGNINISSSPQVMLNNDFNLVDVIKKNVILDNPKDVYDYLVNIFKDGKQPRIDTSKKILNDYSKFYLNNLHDESFVSPVTLNS